MPIIPIQDDEVFVDMHFPRAGIDLSTGFGKQPNRPTDQEGNYSRSTPIGVNVRAYDPNTQRASGGARHGLVRYIPSSVVAGWIVQELNCLVGSGYNPPAGTVQTSNSGRVVSVIAVSQGNVYAAVAGATAWTLATNNTGLTPPLNYSGIMFSAANQQRLYFADGTNKCYYKPSTNSVETWTLTGGSFPVDSSGNTPRLICTWRGRTVQSGLLLDPQNWFMSKVNDPTNYDYSPVSQSAIQAVAGNNSTLGMVGDVITTLIAYSDDVLIFGGDHTIWLMRGDPADGGTLNLVSDSIGMAWGMPWCKDPYGNVYFFSNRTGIYMMTLGQQPQRISQAIEQLILDVDTGANSIRLIWDDRFQGLHVFITPLAAPAPATHLFFEQRSGAWWKEIFANQNHNPLCCVTFDGNLPGDRAPLIGSWDGYVRSISPTATTDDGYAIQSDVVIGPLLTKDLDELLLKDIQGVLGETAGSVSYAVYSGATAEMALSSTPIITGTWGAGRNRSSAVRRSGHALYVRLTASSPWAMETIRARIVGLGKVRRRGA